MRRGLLVRSALLACALPLLAATPDAHAGDGWGAWDDFPAVRISYPSLLAALRQVRDAFPARDQDPRERLRFGPRSDTPSNEDASLDGLDVTVLPEVSNEVDYQIHVWGDAAVRSAELEFQSGLGPRVIVFGDDAARMAAFAAAAKAAFEPYALPILSHPWAATFCFVGLWLAIAIAWSVRARRRGLGKPSRWALLHSLMPMTGVVLLTTVAGRTCFPTIVAYAADASWWARHSCDVYLGLVVGGVTTAMLVGMRLDERARARRETAAADAARAVGAVFS